MSTNANPQTGSEVGQPPPKKGGWLKWVLGCGCGCLLVVGGGALIMFFFFRSAFDQIKADIERDEAKKAAAEEKDK